MILGAIIKTNAIRNISIINVSIMRDILKMIKIGPGHFWWYRHGLFLQTFFCYYRCTKQVIVDSEHINVDIASLIRVLSFFAVSSLPSNLFESLSPSLFLFHSCLLYAFQTHAWMYIRVSFHCLMLPLVYRKKCKLC